ncbi:hypothetical protein Dimus_024225 [Dionaea muscipula]
MGYWRFNCREHMQIVELQNNVKAWKVKYVFVTLDEWDFGDEIAEVLKEPTSKPRAILNEVEMSIRSTFERFWTSGASLWFQVIFLRTLEENGIAIIPHPRMDQMLARLRAMYGSTGSDILEEDETQRRSPDQQQQQQQQQEQQQTTLSLSETPRQASPPSQGSGEVPMAEELPHQEELPEMKSTSLEVSKSASLSSQHDEEESAINVNKGKAPVEVNPSCPTVVQETATKTSSTTPLTPTDVRLSCCILDSINQSVEERIVVAYAMVDNGLYPRDHAILLGTEPRRLRGAMMVNVAEVIELREASTWGRKIHHENGQLLKQVDTHNTLISSPSIEVEEEKRNREELENKMKHRKKWEESLKEEEKKKRKPLHDEIAQLKRNQEHDRSISQHLQEDITNLQREMQSKIDAESRVVQELSKVQSVRRSAEQMVEQQSELNKELRVTNQMLKEWLEDGKKRRKALVGVLNEYDGRLKVNAIQEFIHSSSFEDGLGKVIRPWFKNGFNFCLAQVKDVMQRAGHNLSILKGGNMGKKINFPTEPYVTFPDQYLPSHPSSAKLPTPFMFLKDWTDEEEKKD